MTAPAWLRTQPVPSTRLVRIRIVCTLKPPADTEISLAFVAAVVRRGSRRSAGRTSAHLRSVKVKLKLPTFISRATCTFTLACCVLPPRSNTVSRSVY